MDAEFGPQDQPKLVYVLNAFDSGGAEAGLIRLIAGGVFNGFRLTVVALVRGRGGLEAKLQQLGHSPRILKDTQRMRASDIPMLLLRMWRVLGEEKPGIVIASLPQANILARVCLAFRRDTTFISFEHNTRLAKPVYEWAYRLTSWRVDWMFADAAGTLEAAARRFYRVVPSKQTIVPLVGFSRTAITHRSGPSELIRLVNAARFTAVKNQSALIEAAAILVRRGLNIELTLYGDGPQKEACRDLACRVGLQDRVRFPGFVEKWWLDGADLFVLVSKHEGACLVVLEAMHAGIPVVAAISGGMEDYADSTVLTPLSSLEPTHIADEVLSALGDRVALATCAERASVMVDQRFGDHVVAKTFHQINRLLVNESRRMTPQQTVGIESSESLARHAEGDRL